jgi:hypothetical protein
MRAATSPVNLPGRAPRRIRALPRTPSKAMKLWWAEPTFAFAGCPATSEIGPCPSKDGGKQCPANDQITPRRIDRTKNKTLWLVLEANCLWRVVMTVRFLS